MTDDPHAVSIPLTLANENREPGTALVVGPLDSLIIQVPEDFSDVELEALAGELRRIGLAGRGLILRDPRLTITTVRGEAS